MEISITADCQRVRYDDSLLLQILPFLPQMNADKRRYTQMRSVPDATAIRYRPLAKVDISSITSAFICVNLFSSAVKNLKFLIARGLLIKLLLIRWQFQRNLP
jgi:hypothetical protein